MAKLKEAHVEERKIRVRCLNCFVRIDVPPNVDKITCPNCGIKYMITRRGWDAKIVGEAKE